MIALREQLLPLILISTGQILLWTLTVQHVECVYCTEPKATCCKCKNQPNAYNKCTHWKESVSFIPSRQHLSRGWDIFVDMFFTYLIKLIIRYVALQ